MGMTDTAMSSGTTTRAGGRPRSIAADRAILEATFRALTEAGYAQMSIEAVAAAAGVGKTTIYRRYPTKRELAAAAITAMTVVGPLPVDLDVRTALIGLLTQGREAVVGQRAMTMIGTLLVEERREPELIAMFRERVIGPRRRLLLGLLTAAQARGELRPDADIEVAADMVVGALFAHYLAGEPVDDHWIARLVDTLMLAVGS
jgi:AcrR family transcriptional regulator